MSQNDEKEAGPACVGLPAAEFESLFRRIGLLADALQSTQSARGRATKIGAWLAQHVGKQVPVEHKGRTGTAEPCVREGRGRSKVYWFEVKWDEPAVEAVTEGQAICDDSPEHPDGQTCDHAHDTPDHGDEEQAAAGDEGRDGKREAADEEGNDLAW
jgi:hypothetical protein